MLIMNSLIVNLFQQISMPHLPSLPELIFLFISDSSGFSTWNEFPRLNRGLVYLAMSYNDDLDDDAADRIQTWISLSSTLTLSMLSMPLNGLNRVPNQISKFVNVSQVDFQSNNIPLVTTGTFNFTKAPDMVNVMSSNIVTIEPDAFQGTLFHTVRVDHH